MTKKKNLKQNMIVIGALTLLLAFFVYVIAEDSFTAKTQVINKLQLGSVDVVLTQTDYDGLLPPGLKPKQEGEDQAQHYERSDGQLAEDSYFGNRLTSYYLKRVNRSYVNLGHLIVQSNNQLATETYQEFYHNNYLGLNEGQNTTDHVKNIVPGMVLPMNPVVYYYGQSPGRVRVRINLTDGGDFHPKEGAPKWGEEASVLQNNYVTMIDVAVFLELAKADPANYMASLYEAFQDAQNDSTHIFTLLNPEYSISQPNKRWKISLVDGAALAEYQDTLLPPTSAGILSRTSSIFKELVYPEKMDLLQLDADDIRKVALIAESVQSESFNSKFDWEHYFEEDEHGNQIPIPKKEGLVPKTHERAD